MSERPSGQQRPPARRVRPSNKATAAAQVKRNQQRQQLLRWLGAGLLLAVVVAAGLYFVNRSDDDDSFAGGPSNPATVVAGPPLASSVALDGMTMGDPSAPILVVEYGDYQCPFCTKFARESMSKLVSDYVQTGKIRFEFHEYPIVGSSSDGTFDTDGESFRAAEAALCANDQGQYWPYHNVLYANTVGENKGSFTADRLKTLGTLVPGMDTTAFNACVDARTHTAEVQAMGTAAIADGVTVTPTFKVNGQPVTGADYDQLKTVIEQQIAGP